MRTLRIVLAAAAAVISSLAAHAADVPGSKDHPVVSRYAGSDILKYETKDFDSFSLPTGQVRDRRSGASASQALEGRITRIHYRAPEGRSALEVFRNYEQSLKAGGFTALYQCENQACGNDFSYALNPPSVMHFSGKDQKYLAARLSRPTARRRPTVSERGESRSCGSVSQAG